MYEPSEDPYLATPWVSGPAELLEYALGAIADDSDVNRRVGMVLLDTAVEVTIKVFLCLRCERGGLGLKTEEVTRKGFHGMLAKLIEASPAYLEGLHGAAIMHLHDVRNDLYHQDRGTTPTRKNVERYAHIARVLFSNLYGIQAPGPVITKDQVDEAVAAEFTDSEADLLTRMRLRMLQTDVPAGTDTRLAKLTGRLSEQLWADRRDADAARLVEEAEEFLRQSAETRSDTSKRVEMATSGGRAVYDPRIFTTIAAVEDAVFHLYSDLCRGTFREHLGRIANLIAPVLGPQLASQLGEVVGWRNRVAHLKIGEPPPDIGDLAEEVARAIRERRESISDSEKATWREHYNRNLFG